MSALRLLALSYLASASVFVMAATLAAHPDLPQQIAASGSTLARQIAEHFAPHPVAPEPVVRLTLAPPAPGEARTRAHVQVAIANPHQVEADAARLQPDVPPAQVIVPDLSPESAPVPAEPRLVEPHAIEPDVRMARIPEPPRLESGALRDRASAAALRVKERLTPDMARHFDLILYVSKAKTGPLAQRMVVVQNHDGVLRPIHDWAASTGREQDEISPRGRSSFTATPKGFYELDPDRMYRRYHSFNWDQDMPHAMFFNWERQGVETGLAIHAASGPDIAKLGNRASAGCVHLAPDNAAALFKLVQDYAGKVPRFAYNAATRTMSNSGAFMRDRAGRLKMQAGYRVLVMIDDYGGNDRIADLD